MKKIIIIPDVHCPYHDKKAVTLALKIISHVGPDYVVCLGDFCDMYSASFHDRDPGRKQSLEWEISSCRGLLAEFTNAAPKAKKVFLAGNHEHRLVRFIGTKVPELYGMLTLQQLLQLDDFGWHFVPYKSSYKLGKVHYTHDVGYAGKTAFLKSAAVYGGNVVHGHTHSAGLSYEGSVSGERHVGMSCGWLGDLKAIDYMHQDVARKNWQHGLGFGYMEPSGVTHLSFVPFIRNRAVVEGKLITL